MSTQQTNWYVITGAPSSGKSKVLEHLAFLGYVIRPEIARIIIDEELSKGRTIEDIRSNDELLLRKITKLKTQAEDRTPEKLIAFWERGFPDDIAYHKYMGTSFSDVLEVVHKRRYKRVFLLDMLPVFVKDYARTENKETAEKIQLQLEKVYSELNYDVIKVPVLPISERVNFILSKVMALSSV